jgi:hypothetical protein
MNGSLQLNRYRSARRNSCSMMSAAIEAGIGIGEARLIEADELRTSLAEGRQAFANADPVPDEPVTPQADPQPIPAPEPAPQPKEDDMARGKKTEGTINGEVPKPDFELADTYFRNDIAPANREQKRAMKDASDGWKAVKKDAHVHVGGYRAAMRVAEMEYAEQQAWLRSFNGGLSGRNVALDADMVDKAEGKDPGNVVPLGAGQKPQLATIPAAVPGDTDLADDQQHAAE